MNYKDEGIVLSRKNTGEADRIVTLFTKEHGKLRVYARGVRKIKSKQAGYLDLFVHNKAVYVKGRGLDLITQTSGIDFFKPMRSDLKKVAIAHYVCELISELSPEGQENEFVFDLLLELLEFLNSASPEEARLVLPAFEIRLLGCLGYSPEYKKCVHCGKKLVQGSNYFCPKHGGIVCVDCFKKDGYSKKISDRTIKLFRLLQSKRFSFISRLKILPGDLDIIEKMNEGLLDFVLEKRLNSKNFLHKLKKEIGL